MPRIADILGPPLKTFGTGESHVRFWVVEKRICVAATAQVGTAELARRTNEACQELIDSGLRIHMVHDWGDIERYEPDTRSEFAEWALKHRAHIGRAYYLARSRLLQMALSVMGMTFAKGLRVFTDDQRFYDAFVELCEHVRAKNATNP